MKWTDIPGWFDFSDTYDAAVARFPSGQFVEVGCYLGKSLCYLAERVRQSGKPIHVVGVDTCRGSGVENGHDNHTHALCAGGGTFAGALHRNVIECGVADVVDLVVCDSVRAAEFFADGSLEFIFLDAAHDQDAVEADLQAWLPKLRVGGVIAGDDVGVPGQPVVWPGVLAAVNKMLPGWVGSRHDCFWYEKR